MNVNFVDESLRYSQEEVGKEHSHNCCTRTGRRKRIIERNCLNLLEKSEFFPGARVFFPLNKILS